MGDILRAKCSCGLQYNFKTGMGEQGIEASHVPAYCQHCKAFLLLKFPEEADKCPQCGRAPTLYCRTQEEQASQNNTKSYTFQVRQQRFFLPRKGNFCPQCGKDSLQFQDVGFWD